MDVTMPDGTVIRGVPEGTTKSQLLSRYQKYQGGVQSAPEPAAPEARPQRSIPQEIGRQAALAGRAVVQGVASLPLMAADAGVAARNLVGNLSKGITPTLADFNPFAKTGGTPQEYELPSKIFNESLTKVGVPEPITASEKIAGFVESVLAGSRTPAPQAAKQAPAGFSNKPPLNQVRDATLKAAQKEGYVVPPATSNPTMANRALEGISGKISTAQQAAVRNQSVTNRLARQAVGLSNHTPITPESLRALRSEAGKVYALVGSAGQITADSKYLDDLAELGKGVDEIAKDFPGANVGASKQIDGLVNSLLKDKFDSRSALAYLKELRNQARGNLSPMNYDPAKQALGMAQREAASTLEDLVGRHLEASGTPELAQSFQQARKLIAVSHTVENALNESTGNVSASKLGAQLAKGKPLSGELAIAAKFSRAFPKAAKEVNESMPGVSPLDYYGSIGAAGLFGNPHLLLLPAIRMAIRNALLSPFGQKAATKAVEAAGEAPQTIGVPLSTAIQANQSVARQ